MPFHIIYFWGGGGGVVVFFVFFIMFTFSLGSLDFAAPCCNARILSYVFKLELLLSSSSSSSFIIIIITIIIIIMWGIGFNIISVVLQIKCANVEIVCDIYDHIYTVLDVVYQKENGMARAI